MHPLLRTLTIFGAASLLAGHALAAQAGWRQIEMAGTAPAAATTVVALYYPTQAPERAIAMGPFTVNVAPQAAPAPAVKGLILLSHGTGGSELGHSSLAEALARAGYLVAALRHPGDNWQDATLLKNSPARYFDERPRQASRVIDALLHDPLWRDRIARDAHGPRIGALGHSAGGYTVLALAGGEPDLARIRRHCAQERAEDPIFCNTGDSSRMAPAVPSSPTPPNAGPADPRVRAVVALAPVGAVFSTESLARIRIPVALYIADADRWLVPRFHGDRVAQNVAGVEVHRVANAGHFAFMDTPSIPLPSADGDIGTNPPGFERAAFLKQLASELPTFFDRAFRDDIAR